jgi:hypothetical protein
LLIGLCVPFQIRVTIKEKPQSYSRNTVGQPRRREATTINEDEESQRWRWLRY